MSNFIETQLMMMMMMKSGLTLYNRRTKVTTCLYSDVFITVSR